MSYWEPDDITVLCDIASVCPVLGFYMHTVFKVSLFSKYSIHVENAQILSNSFMSHNKMNKLLCKLSTKSRNKIFSALQKLSHFLSATATSRVNVILTSNSKINICVSVFI